MPGSASILENNNRERLFLATVLLLTFLVYLPVVRFDFIYDDVLISPDNPGMQWTALPGFFVHNIWGEVPGLGSSYFRPFANAWALINFKLFGQHPWGFHLTSIFVHLFATTLVFLVTRKLTDNDPFIAAAATTIFALHPIHAEAISWISAFADPWMAACVLASLFYFLRFREEPQKRKWLVYSLIWFAAGLMFKETAIVLLGIVAGCISVERQAFTGSRQWRVLGAFALVATVYLLLRHQALQGPSRPSTLPWSAEILSWPQVLWFYVRHLLFPYHLSVVYYLNYVRAFEWRMVLVPLVAVCAVIGALYRLAKPGRQIAAMVALLILVLPILPTLHLRIFRWRDLAHDRYLYLPSVGFSILIALLLARLPRAGERTLFGQPAIRALLLILIAAISVFGVAQDIRPFTNNYTLSARAVELGPDNAPMLWAFAAELESRGKADDALTVYQRLARLVPQAKEPIVAMAKIELQQKKYAAAREHLLHSLQLQVGDSQLHYLLGLTFDGEHNFAAAEQCFRQAAELTPKQPGLHELIARALEAQGKKGEAQAEHERELELNSPPKRVGGTNTLK